MYSNLAYYKDVLDLASDALLTSPIDPLGYVQEAVKRHPRCLSQAASYEGIRHSRTAKMRAWTSPDRMAQALELDVKVVLETLGMDFLPESIKRALRPR